MKRPNNSGGVRKLNGNRRKPYQAVVSAGHEIRNNRVCVKQISLGTFATKKEALAALGLWQNSHVRADMINMTVDDVYHRLWDYWTPAIRIAMRTAYNHYRVLGNRRLFDIRTYTIEDVPLPPLSESAHNGIRSLWHRIFMFGIENDIVQKDYSSFIKFKEVNESKKKEPFAPNEIRETIDIKLYRILLYTGMRINELLTMKTEQVYDEDGVLCFHVLESKTETGKRIIPVHSEIVDWINLSDEYVITPKVPYDVAKQNFNKFAADKKFAYHTLHDFRRTFASYAKSCGLKDYYTKCLLGHAHGNITDAVYTKPFVKDLKKQIELLRYDV